VGGRSFRCRWIRRSAWDCSNNLGLVLSGTNAGRPARSQLQQLQALLPTVNASAKEAVQQTNLAGRGSQDYRLPGRHLAPTGIRTSGVRYSGRC